MIARRKNAGCFDGGALSAYIAGHVAMSAVTQGELLYGIAKRPEATRLHVLVTGGQGFGRIAGLKIENWAS
jgi:predicted nucleic acid-binding protein